MDTIGFTKHDHAACISTGVAAVSAYCTDNGLQFTPVRRRVLEILLTAHQAMGAYDILEILREEGLGSQPPVVYRALEFLIGHGFAHRIERLNAFIACTHPRETHAPVFLICRQCNAVAEACVAPAAGFLGRIASEIGFQITRSVVEVEGLCPNCQKEKAA